MDFARPTFWNIHDNYLWAEIGSYVLGFSAGIIFLVGFAMRVLKWRQGQSEPSTEPITQRVVNLVKYAIFQMRLASDPYSLVMHLAIFWGMVFLFLGTAIATIDWDVAHLIFDFQFLKGTFYQWFELILDVFGIVLLVGLGMAVYRRYVMKPERLKATVYPKGDLDALYLIAVLFLITVTGYAIEGLRIVGDTRIEANSTEPWAPVGFLLSKAFGSLSDPAIGSTHLFFWCVHTVLSCAFVASIPFTKAFHVFSSTMNIFFRNPTRMGELTDSDKGVKELGGFTWRQLMQLDACTSCGKCQDVCPGHATGFPLSPKKLVESLDAKLRTSSGRKDDASGDGGQEAQEGEEGEEKKSGSNGNGSLIASDELWACCTCGACEEVCPVFVRHPRLIVEMRRNLIEQGDVDEGLQDALMSLQRYGNSHGKSARKRFEWAKSLPKSDVFFGLFEHVMAKQRGEWAKGAPVPVKDATKEPVDVLWFLGDYASYHPSAVKASGMAAQILHIAGVDFGALLKGEQSAGNDVRRVGEEGLFEMLAEKNMKALENADFKRIVTTDPHTYNALKHEYGRFGLDKPVQHYTELLDELIQSGDLKFSRKLDSTVTYHDPCYLGRYNDVYDAPRRVLAALGVKLVEMPRNRENSFCCGAGGGKIWMKDVPGIEERPAELRVKEALALPGVQYLVVACPKDLGMFEDAVKTVGAEDKLQVVDLAELVLQATQADTTEEAEQEEEAKT